MTSGYTAVHLPCCHCHVAYGGSTNPLLWHQDRTWPSDFGISPVVVGYLGTFRLLFCLILYSSEVVLFRRRDCLDE